MKIKKEGLANSISYIRYLYNGLLSKRLADNNMSELKTSYGSIIYALLKHETMTMKDLADSIKRDRSTLTVLIRNLEKKGYVTKTDNPDDARSKFVELTDKGKGREQAFIAISNELNERMWCGIDDEEAQVFLRCLGKITKNLIGQEK